MTGIAQADISGPRKGATTKASIVAAAARLFAERGFAGTSMNDLLHATGLTKGAFYFHFASKAELAFSVIQVEGDRWVAWLRAERKPRAAAADQLIGVVDAMRRLIAAEPEVWSVRRLGRELHGDPVIGPRMVGAMRRWLGLVEDIVEDGQSSGEFGLGLSSAEAAALIVGGFEGAKELTDTLDENQEFFAARLDSLVAVVQLALAPTGQKGTR